MAISGLVLAVAEGASGEAALRALRADPRLTLGEHFGRRVAAGMAGRGRGRARRR